MPAASDDDHLDEAVAGASSSGGSSPARMVADPVGLTSPAPGTGHPPVQKRRHVGKSLAPDMVVMIDAPTT